VRSVVCAPHLLQGGGLAGHGARVGAVLVDEMQEDFAVPGTLGLASLSPGVV
jgi:hypothetical protein